MLFELAERRGGPELERFVSLSNERDELRETINTLILSAFDPSANEEMVRMSKRNGGYIPKLCGPQEVAELLGVSRQRVYQLRADRPDFPAPLQTLRSGPIWDERDIKAWKKETGR